MSKVESGPTTYEEAVQTLARWHGESETLGVDIYCFDDPERKVVRLLEVSDAFLTMGEAWPVTFGESEEFRYKTSVILASRQDYEALQDGKIAMPDGWGDVKCGRKVWPAP